MTIEDFLTPDNVVLDLRVRDKRQLVAEVAQRLASSLPDNQPREIEIALLAREQLGSTGLGNGFALPHARIDGLRRFRGLFARLSRPISFDAIDGKDVQLAFVLLVPNNDAVPHVAALATISRRLREPSVITTLLNCRHRDEAFEVLTRS